MRIQEVIGTTGLSRKAIEDHIGQGLICPVTSDRGYCFFDQEGLLRLKKLIFTGGRIRYSGNPAGPGGEYLNVLRDAVIRERISLKRRQLSFRKCRKELLVRIREMTYHNLEMNERGIHAAGYGFLLY